VASVSNCIHCGLKEILAGQPLNNYLLYGQVQAVLQRKEFSDLELDELRHGLGLLSDDITCTNVEEPRVEATYHYTSNQ